MLISGREASAELAEAGISERRARRALACGLAGPPIRTRAAHLYDATHVRELGERRIVWSAEMERRCPDGYFLSRRALQVDVDREVLLRELSVVPDGMSPWTRTWLSLRGELCGGVPFVATVAGFVVHGADLVGIRGGQMHLADPGTWFEGLADAQLGSSLGRTWTIVAPRRGRAARVAAVRSPTGLPVR